MKGWLIVFVSGLVGSAAFFLVRGVQREDPAALMTLGGILVLSLVMVGGALALGTVWFTHHVARTREEREQAQFREDTHESVRVMAALSRAQNTQNQMLLRQARDLQRALPGPGDTIDIDALTFDDAVFSELEED